MRILLALILLSLPLAACGKKPNIGELEPTQEDNFPGQYPKPWL